MSVSEKGDVSFDRIPVEFSISVSREPSGERGARLEPFSIVRSATALAERPPSPEELEEIEARTEPSQVRSSRGRRSAACRRQSTTETRRHGDTEGAHERFGESACGAGRSARPDRAEARAASKSIGSCLGPVRPPPRRFAAPRRIQRARVVCDPEVCVLPLCLRASVVAFRGRDRSVTRPRIANCSQDLKASRYTELKNAVKPSRYDQLESALSR